MSAPIIRTASPHDASALRAIYAPYVRQTAITFEYDVPTVGEFAQRIARTLERYPYLVAERDGEVLGYAYAGPFKGRAAYDWSCETSIYVRQEEHGQGVGGALYDALERALLCMGIQNLYACVSFPPQQGDPHLSTQSVAFHEHRGFAIVGRFSRCGYKFDRWYDMVWMERIIGAHDSPQPALVPFSQIERSCL